MDKLINKFQEIQKFQTALGDYPSLVMAIKGSGIKSEMIMTDIFDSLVNPEEYRKAEKKYLVDHLLQQAQKKPL